jgi:hypothetical protein
LVLEGSFDVEMVEAMVCREGLAIVEDLLL